MKCMERFGNWVFESPIRIAGCCYFCIVVAVLFGIAINHLDRFIVGH